MSRASELAGRGKASGGWETCLREVREGHGLSQGVVAGETGLSVLTVANAERGMNVSLLTAMKLSVFYDLPIEELWTGRVVE